MHMNEPLLRPVLATISRQACPPDNVVEILCTGPAGKKQIAAYNLYDRVTPQSEIGTRAGLDKGSLSRSLARWQDAGIIFRVRPDQVSLHLYLQPRDANVKPKQVAHVRRDF